VGLLTQVLWRRLNLAYAFLANVIGGIVVVYAIGIPFTSVYADVPLTTSFLGSLLFIPGDAVKALIAALVAVGVRRAYPVIELPARQPASH
jgi:biotin transport system substrate-specific component